MSPEAPLIRVFGDSDSLEELTEFLHRSYKSLADMGLRYLATHQSAQRQGVRSLLIERAEELARKDNASEIALDTAEPAMHLIEWYKRIGFRFIEYAESDVTNYCSVIMSKRL
ncbi:MAG: GNAT family N-acetyltransferase [candidate division Zixibacteria bacterium]|nr:GNAT family N-acetyltransferase [candidate division Zixibacteria bacterium]